MVIPPYVAGPLRLAPFRALMLGPTRIGDPASARAFARPYKDVAARLARWQEHRQMWHDPSPAIYLHEYTAAGITIRGLVGLVDVSRRATSPEDRAILPHEGIYPAQADDLASRMEEMQLNPAPILLVHRATAELRALTHELLALPADHDFTDRAQQHHRVWAIRDPGQASRIDVALARSRPLIADGHHRYAAYLRLQQRSPDGPARYGLAMLVDQDDTPLFLGAIHRVFSGTSLDDVLLACASVGLPASELNETAAIAALAPRQMVVTDSERWAAIELPEGHDQAAVEVLHDRLVPAFPHGPRRVSYHHTADDALAQVGPDLGVAMLMPAPEVGQVLHIAGHDRLLPEKATSFQPKPSLGVLIRSLRDG